MENYKNSKIGRETAQKYGDILEMERPQTEESLRKHPRMTLQNRAKIFSPFSPLRGYDEHVHHNSRFGNFPARYLFQLSIQSPSAACAAPSFLKRLKHLFHNVILHAVPLHEFFHGCHIMHFHADKHII